MILKFRNENSLSGKQTIFFDEKFIEVNLKKYEVWNLELKVLEDSCSRNHLKTGISVVQICDWSFFNLAFNMSGCRWDVVVPGLLFVYSFDYLVAGNHSMRIKEFNMNKVYSPAVVLCVSVQYKGAVMTLTRCNNPAADISYHVGKPGVMIRYGDG